jgi:hypothetical protein
MLDEAAGCDDFVAGLRPATRGTKGKSAGRLASGSSQRGWRRHRAKAGVFAFAPTISSIDLLIPHYLKEILLTSEGLSFYTPTIVYLVLTTNQGI